MTREELVSIALESASRVKTDHNGFRLIADGLDIERFTAIVAAIVAADEREKLAKHFEQANQAGIHTDWVAAAIRARGKHE